jgi:transcription initiation factor TFIIIB Brf1 subunit/transcription initiation factor TFIIB
MWLRTGKVINCRDNDKEYKAYTNHFYAVVSETNFTMNKCKMLHTLFRFLDKYSEVFLNDNNFVVHYRILSKKFIEFIQDFEKQYYDNKKSKNKKTNYFCKCGQPKADASLNDIRSGNPDVFDKELHNNEETMKSIIKWSIYFNQPHRKERKLYTLLSKKTNTDIASLIMGYL